MLSIVFIFAAFADFDIQIPILTILLFSAYCEQHVNEKNGVNIRTCAN